MKKTVRTKIINNKSICTPASISTFITLIIAALSLIIITTGCSDTEGTDYEYIVDETTKGTYIPEAADSIVVSSRIGFALSMNKIGKLRTTNTVPHKIISGTDIIREFKYVVSKELRVERLLEPTGVRIVQVDMSMGSPLALKQVLSSATGDFNPGPILHDDIGYYYHPIGYTLDTPSGKRKIEVNINPGKQIKDLTQLPALSRSKQQILKVFFRVNQGVTLTALSYAGQDKILFTVEVPNRPDR